MKYLHQHTHSFAGEPGIGGHCGPDAGDAGFTDVPGSRGRGMRGPGAHRMRGGGGPFGGPPFGGGPFGGPPFGGGRGRKRRGDVRAALLVLLAEEPRNGYQIMQTIEERSGGRWRPSPGSVYPALAQLEDEGLVRSIETDAGRAFELTDAGRQEVEARGEQPPPWGVPDENDPGHQLRVLIGGTAQAAALVVRNGDEEQLRKAVEVLTDARRALYRILSGDAES
jgi:DNA-binding PadR family transcriptional regulator